MRHQTLIIILFVLGFLSCETAVATPEEKSEMDKLCECFEMNNAYTIKVNAEQDSLKKSEIVATNAERLENCRGLATKIGDALSEINDKERKENQESFQNSCSAYKEFIDNNN